MEANIETQLERYNELAGKICSYTNKEQKEIAFESIINKIKSLIPDTISNKKISYLCDN